LIIEDYSIIGLTCIEEIREKILLDTGRSLPVSNSNEFDIPCLAWWLGVTRQPQGA